MRQLFKRTRVLLPLLVLLAVPATSFGQTSGRAWEEAYDTVPGLGWWTSFKAMNAGVIDDWKSKAAATSKWHSNDECQNAMYYTLDALEYADIQAGTGSFAGEYFGPLKKGGLVNDADVIVVNVWYTFDEGGFGTLVHEAWHRATGDSDADITALNDSLKTSSVGRPIEECHDEAREEEEDDDEPNGGGNPKTETCTETQEWVPPVTEEVFVKPESSTLEGGPPVPTKHEAVPIPGITVSVDSGRWVERVIEKGYWKTVKECTES